jgi:hypothetical protein
MQCLHRFLDRRILVEAVALNVNLPRQIESVMQSPQGTPANYITYIAAHRHSQAGAS